MVASINDYIVFWLRKQGTGNTYIAIFIHVCIFMPAISTIMDQSPRRQPAAAAKCPAAGKEMEKGESVPVEDTGNLLPAMSLSTISSMLL